VGEASCRTRPTRPRTLCSQLEASRAGSSHAQTWLHTACMLWTGGYASLCPPRLEARVTPRKSADAPLPLDTLGRSLRSLKPPT
jgi:hypothetical protein